VSLEESIVDELQRVRKGEGLNLATMAACPTLCRLLGQGDPVLAIQTLTANLKAYGADRDIEAALAALGMTIRRATLLDRLSEFGEAFQVDQRTVRRWADSGMSKLAVLAVKTWIIRPPRLEIRTRLQGTGAVLLLRRRVPINYQMADDPTIVVHYEGESYRESLPFGEPTVDDNVEVRTTNLGMQLNTNVPIQVEIQWMGEVWPEFEFSAIDLHPDYYFLFRTFGNTARVQIGPVAQSGSRTDRPSVGEA
jgi:hypothetical protein